MTDPQSFVQRLEAKNRATPPTPAAPPITPTVDGNGYAYKALANESALVARAVNGTRNATLNTAAFNLARFVNDGQLTADEVRDTLTGAARAVGLDDAEIDVCLRGDRHQRDAAAKRPGPAIPERTPATTNPRPANPPAELADALDAAHHPIWGTHQPIDAAGWLFDHEDTTTALWGHDDHILWAEGEALMIAGGMGLGKTTLAGQIIRAQLGLDDNVLGQPVAPTQGPILYLAMDRPRQIRRSMLRQYERDERAAIDGKLLIRPGPPLADLAVRPTLLAEMAQACGATVVYVDSLKDAAIGLSGDEVGAAYNRARQYALANNIQVCELHHLIKRTPLGAAPSSVADVYGSNWLTAGAGSVIMLTGDPGDPIVEFRHVKQPHTEVGPFRILHDPIAGRFTIDHEVDLVALAGAAGPHGLSPQGAAAAIFERDKPTRAQVEKARRRLDKLTNSGHLVRVEGVRGGAVDGTKGSTPANYFKAG